MRKDYNLLYGLVLAGGKSTRMKTDKASLEYFGQKQYVHCFHLLNAFCPKVFLSLRKGQKDIKEKDFPKIYDISPFLDRGPLGGILSAMKKHPRVSWLVLACDLPYVDEKVIQSLIDQRNPKKMATAFQSTHDGLPEPLCTVYEAQSQRYLKMAFSQGIHCPRNILTHADVELLVSASGQALDNINNPQEYKEALRHLGNGKK